MSCSSLCLHHSVWCGAGLHNHLLNEELSRLGYKEEPHLKNIRTKKNNIWRCLSFPWTVMLHLWSLTIQVKENKVTGDTDYKYKAT